MRPFTPAWLAGDPTATALLPRAFDRPEARAAAVHAASQRSVHPAVLSALHDRATTPEQRRSAARLDRPGAACVLTGQQAGAFGGPLFTVYKAIAAIAAARALEQQTGTPCVPVFWLQNEDHDFDEIAACTVVDGAGAPRTVRLASDPSQDGRSIGARVLGHDVPAALDALEDAVGGLSHAAEAMALLRACWRPGVAPDAAFGAWVDALFGRHGLLVLDPRSPGVGEAAAPLHARAIDQAAPISALLQERADALQAAGFAVQVHVRPGAPLSFVHPDGPDGPRYRVDPEGAGFRLVGTDRVVDAAAVRRGPHSTSALLRPVLQDSVLPVAAYVGGPGEIAYFAQLPPLYAHLGLPMPLIVPRARFRVVDETASRLLDQLGLAPDDLAAGRDALLARVVRPPDGLPDPDALLGAITGPAHAALSVFSAEAGAVDPALAPAADKTARAIAEAAGRLADRYRRALAQRDGVAADRLDRLLARLQPGGAPQERVCGWPWAGARYGVDGFVDAVLAAAVPFDGSLQELRP